MALRAFQILRQRSKNLRLIRNSIRLQSSFTWNPKSTNVSSSAAANLKTLDPKETAMLIMTNGSYALTDPSYLKVILYPEDSDEYLKELEHVQSLQQIFDLIESIPSDKLAGKHSAQCLVSLWDIQKLIFTFGQFYNVKGEGSDPEQFVLKLLNHEVFKKVLNHVLEVRETTNDIGLAAVLVVLKKFGFSIRGPECQLLIEELLRRKDTLSLPALSRISVAMRSESLYGASVLLELLPRISHFIATMESELDVRLVSIALRRAYFSYPDSVIYAYRDRLEAICKDGQDRLSSFEPVTFCKILMLLFRTQNIEEWGVRNKTAKLLQTFGKALIPVLNKTHLMDLTSLANFVNREFEPADLYDAVNERIMNLTESFPSLHLISCIQPQNIKQRVRLSEVVKKELRDSELEFGLVSNLIYRTLMKSLLDFEVCDMFWDRVGKLVITAKSSSAIGRYDYLATLVESEGRLEEEESDDEDVVVISLKGEEPYSSAKELLNRSRILSRWAHGYTRFLFACRGGYVNESFEEILTREILHILRKYNEAPFILFRADYANLLGFLVATRYPDWKYYVWKGFIDNFRPTDLSNLQKAMEIECKFSKKYWKSDQSELLDLLNKQAESLLKLPLGSLNLVNYNQIAQLNVDYQRMFTSSPVFSHCVQMVDSQEWTFVKTVRDQMQLALISSYYSPSVFERTSRFICNMGSDTPYSLADKFLIASYASGIEIMDGHYVAADVISRNYKTMPVIPLLYSMIAMCYLGCLSTPLVNQIFSVSFIDSLDEMIQSTKVGRHIPDKIKNNFMQLNRAVCLDMPEANVPWFHETFCMDRTELNYFRRSPMHSEIYGILLDIVPYDEKVVQYVYSPYYYLLDFVIQEKSLTSSSQSDRQKIAIMVGNARDYTTNVRRLKGQSQLRRRHLEILGYKVVDIDPLVWNSMHMSEKSAKRNFLLRAMETH